MVKYSYAKRNLERERLLNIEESTNLFLNFRERNISLNEIRIIRKKILLYSLPLNLNYHISL